MYSDILELIKLVINAITKLFFLCIVFLICGVRAMINTYMTTCGIRENTNNLELTR